VHFDGVLRADLLFDQEGLDGLTLVALELKNLTFGFLVLEHCAVAAMLLLDCLQNLLEIQCFGEASHSSDGFASVTLLDANVNVALIKLDRSTADLSSSSVREWIWNTLFSTRNRNTSS